MKYLARLFWVVLSGPLAAGVVVNELAYHPPNERDDLQFVELHNPDLAPADLSGWKFSAGIEFGFPAGTRLAAGGYLVVARDPAALAEQYQGVKSLGPFRGALKHSGERVTLRDAAGKTVDSVKYSDRAPWPVSPDGFGPTLERVAAAGQSEDPANWAPSKLLERETPTGSPERANGRVQAAVPAGIPELTITPWQDGTETKVSARVEDSAGVENVSVQWQVVVPGQAAGAFQETVAQRISGDHRSGRYEATLPVLPAGQFLRYRLGVKSASE